MLGADLLKTRVRGDQVQPAFVEADDDSLALVEDIVRAFGDHAGGKLGELRDILAEMEDQGFDYRLVRGLVELLERRCDLAVESAAPPGRVRREVFSRGRPAVTPEEREEAVAAAAERLGLRPEAVEASMFADLEGELRIRRFDPPAPRALLGEYNLALAQALLFRATELRFSAASRHKEVLRSVKRLGLMYAAAYDGGRLEIAIDGPLSAVKATERYGTSLARLLPWIVAAPGWSVDASIMRRDFQGNARLYRFSMTERAHGRLFAGAAGAYPEVDFDSEPEERFYEAFANAGTGWSIVREPEPLVAGRYLYVPDFLLERDGMRVYVEVAGFWTADYLRRKVAKLGELQGVDLVVLASTRAACDAFRGIAEDVVLFDRKIPLKEVLDRLRARDESRIGEGVARLCEMRPKVSGDLVALEDVARETGVGADAVRRYFEGLDMPAYVLSGSQLVSRRLLEGLAGALPSEMPYAEASAAIRSRGIAAVDPVLKFLGYTVRWSGIDPENAMVRKGQ